MVNKELYISKENRKNRVNQLKSEGYIPILSTHRNQQLHPMYIQDYTQVTGIELKPEDKGFGNTIYKTYFKTLYIVSW